MTPFERLQALARPGRIPAPPREMVGALQPGSQTAFDRLQAHAQPGRLPMQQPQMAAPPAMPPQAPQGQPQATQGPLSAFRDPVMQQGLLGLGMGLLEASGPSTTPTSFGQAMSRGMNAGVGMMQQERGNQMQERMYGLREQQIEADNAEAAAKADELAQTRAMMSAVRNDPNTPPHIAAMPDPVLMTYLNEQAKVEARPEDTPAGTAAMQDAAALGLQPGTPAYEKYIMDRTLKPQSVSTTHITMPADSRPQFGSVPPGEMMVQTGPNAWQQMPVPGGPVDREMQAAAAKTEGLEATKNIARGTVVQDVGRALEMVTNQPDLATGMVGAASRLLPSSPAYVLQGHIDSIGSNIGLDVLQTMRENSPTGGALGQVPIQQQQRLEAVYGNLALGQPAEVLSDNLKRIENIYNDLIHGTPAQIQGAVDEGRISAADAAPLMQRHQLSFDERGRPQAADRQAPPDPNTAPVEDILEYWANQ